jgi:uncharacterized protein
MKDTKLTQYLLLFAGVAAVCIGFVGIFVPLLPTTPFLLIAAACFVRSSERSYNWLINHRWFGSYIRNYREYGAVALHGKIGTLVLLWGAIGYAAFFEVSNWPLRTLLGVIAVGVTIHILRLKTFKPEMVEEHSPKTLTKKEVSEPVH